ncbi:MAG TPA: phosphotransferase [Actinomycetes bacterium]|jgi:aminoglycoside phosphotransferase (APT) family kinase protein|nr:phosphotransferase [Actinomycetes bacterium]
MPSDRVERLLRRRPPATALAWAAAAVGPGARVAGVRPLASGWLANHVLEVRDAAGRPHRLVLRRWARPGWDEDDPALDAAREATVLGLLADAGVDAPRLLAADPDATACDVPALLVSHIRGRPPRLDRADRAGQARTLEGLAAALPPIHAVDGGVRALLPGWRRYHPPELVRPPAWSPRPGLWAQAIEATAGPPPGGPVGLIHRDYHPGNTLWAGGRLAGVVDWTAASVGPPAADLAHMRVNLALDLGLAVADAFLARHRAVTGGVDEHHPWWDAMDAVDLLPDLPEPTAEQATGLEALVTAALAGLA